MALERGAARQVQDVRALADAVSLYYEQPDLRREAGRAAHSLIDDNRGALARTLELMTERLPQFGLAGDEAERRDEELSPS